MTDNWYKPGDIEAFLTDREPGGFGWYVRRYRGNLEWDTLSGPHINEDVKDLVARAEEAEKRKDD